MQYPPVAHNVFLENHPRPFSLFSLVHVVYAQRPLRSEAPFWRLRDALPPNIATFAGIYIYLLVVPGPSEARRRRDEK